jgi:glycerophosphoryl diester phosphodiesterase
MKPWVIAHRGASGYAPENTLAAFQRAVELGAGFIETDLHLTRDARFVVIHDDTLERTTGGHGAVHDFTLAELRELDAGTWFDRQFSGERIPTIEDVLAFSQKYDVIFYLDAKYNAAWGMHHSLAGALRDYQNTARTVVLSFDPSVLEALRRLDPSVMTGLLCAESAADAVKASLDVGARQMCPRAALVTPELVDEAHRSDLCIVAWTANKPEEMRSLIAAGVDGIMTDFPDRLRAILEP